MALEFLSTINVTGSAVNQKWTDSDSPGLTYGLLSEVGGQLFDFGTNFTQLGCRNVDYPGGLIRLDLRDTFPNEFFNVKYTPASGVEETIYQVSRTGDIITKGTMKGTVLSATTCFVGSGAGLTGTASSLTAGSALCLGGSLANTYAKLTDPTFSGTVGGITAAMVGAGGGQYAQYTFTSGAEGWVRIAVTNYIGYGTISITNTYSNNAPGPVTFSFATTYLTNGFLTQINGTNSMFSKARIVYPTVTNGIYYVEVYCNSNSVGNTYLISLSDTSRSETSLYTSFIAGSIPADYSSNELTFINGVSTNGCFAGNGAGLTGTASSLTVGTAGTALNANFIFNSTIDNNSVVMFNTNGSYYAGLAGNVANGISIVKYNSPNGLAANAVSTHEIITTANIGTQTVTIATCLAGHSAGYAYADGGTSTYTCIVNGCYSGSGGAQPPSYIPSGGIRFNMMNCPGNGGYYDFLMMDTYTGGDVAYVTLLGLAKQSGVPHGIIGVAGKGCTSPTNWTYATLITSANISSQTVNNSTCAGGLVVNTDRNNVANQIVRNDGSGYLQVGYINSDSGNEGNASNPARVWGTNGSDNYMRTYCTANLSVAYANTAGCATDAGNAYNLISAGGMIQTTIAGTSYIQHIKVRETLGYESNSSEAGAPALGFLWSGVVASNILMEASGRISIRNDPGTSYENFAANCGTAVDWIATSDCRIKTCIRPITCGLSTVLELVGVHYELCDDAKHENQIGFIAQDVRKVLPEVVTSDAPTEMDYKYGICDEKLGIKYDKLSAVLVEAIKELNKKVDKLCLELNYMRNNNTGL